MCRWHLDFDFLIRLSLQWFVLLQGTGHFQKWPQQCWCGIPKLLRSVVGPPAATDRSRPWPEILHDWNARVAQFVQQYSVKCWSVRCVEMHWNLAQSVYTHYWKFARYVACLPSHRWVKRVLARTPPGSRNAGRPANSWGQKLVTNYCRYKNFGHWVDAAEDQHWWESHLDDFINFCRLWV